MDNNAAVLDNRTVYLKNYKDGGYPQTAASVGIKYTSPQYIHAGANINFYDDIYIEATLTGELKRRLKIMRPIILQEEILDQQQLMPIIP
ncbi:MAG: hypothetical protein R2764_20790 [Bacteroidales bacterium]